LADHDRPLAPRGQRAVKLLHKHLADNDIHPAQVLCSSARRTVETCAGVDPGGELLIEPELYAANGDEVLERLRKVPADTPSVMLIGHNPALQTLVLRLTGANGDVPAESDLAEVQRKFPTAALATLSFDCAWSELEPGRAKLDAFLRPRDLH
jgi:phosphohistidine phosphatase